MFGSTSVATEGRRAVGGENGTDAIAMVSSSGRHCASAFTIGSYRDESPTTTSDPMATGTDCIPSASSALRARIVRVALGHRLTMTALRLMARMATSVLAKISGTKLEWLVTITRDTAR
eukprot:4539133-Prymnesium_polylepis.1